MLQYLDFRVLFCPIDRLIDAIYLWWRQFTYGLWSSCAMAFLKKWIEVICVLMNLPFQGKQPINVLWPLCYEASPICTPWNKGMQLLHVLFPRQLWVTDVQTVLQWLSHRLTKEVAHWAENVQGGAQKNYVCWSRNRETQWSKDTTWSSIAKLVYFTGGWNIWHTLSCWNREITPILSELELVTFLPGGKGVMKLLNRRNQH